MDRFDYPRISVSLSPSDLAAVHALSEAEERSLSAIVRRIVREALDKPRAKPETNVGLSP